MEPQTLALADIGQVVKVVEGAGVGGGHGPDHADGFVAGFPVGLDGFFQGGDVHLITFVDRD